MFKVFKLIAVLLLVALVAAVAWRLNEVAGKSDSSKGKRSSDKPVPVEVADITRQSVQLIRRFTGTLKANAEFIVAPKIAGRLQLVHVDLADRITRGMVVAEIDQAELKQQVAQAEAELLVAKANHSEAQQLLVIAERELKRIEKLRKTGVSSAAQIDTASAEQLAKAALVNVTRAKITKAEAELEAARIQLQETTIKADWRGGSDERLVAERYVDEGETVSANTALLKIVELDPLIAVFAVTEADYANLSQGQSVQLSTDAFVGETFAGKITRISPVFSEDTRQARVEVTIDNARLKLKPGMFVRLEVVIRQANDAIVIPERALYKRDEKQGVFLLMADAGEVQWQPVTAGISQNGLVQVVQPVIEGKVVTLGQQMLKPGSKVKVVE